MFRSASTGIEQDLERAIERAGGLMRSAVRMASLELRNRVTRAACVAHDGPVVSMTTYGARLRLVHLALESIAAGSTRPSRLILWLDADVADDAVPRGLRRLEKRGLEILRTRDLGPHKKYFPYAASLARHEVPLVTADDDWMVPRRWLEELAAAVDGRTVVAHRAHRIRLDESGEVQPYETWRAETSTDARVTVFGTGCFGQWLPAPLLDRLRDAGDAFLLCAPRADDVYLHHEAITGGHLVRWSGAFGESDFVPIRGANVFSGAASVEALHESNVDGGGNDAQIRATYGRRASELFQSALGSEQAARR